MLLLFTDCCDHILSFAFIRFIPKELCLIIRFIVQTFRRAF